MDIAVCWFCWNFLLYIGFLGLLYRAWSGRRGFNNSTLDVKRWGLDHFHQFLPFLPFLFLLFVYLFLFFSAALRNMLRLTLIKIAIKLVPAWTTFNIIFFIIIAIIKISKIFLPLLNPKRIFLLLFFAIDKVGHFGSPSFPELHVSDCIILWIDLRCWLFRWIIFVISLAIIWVLWLSFLARLIWILIIMWRILLILLFIFFIKLLFLWLLSLFYSPRGYPGSWR